MISPNYLPTADRNRLLEINQQLLTDLLGEDALILSPEQAALILQHRTDKLKNEAAEIQKRTKTLQTCTLDELQDFHQQLYSQYQKHIAMSSKQAPMIAKYIKQVEYRKMMISTKQIDEPEKTESPVDKPKTTPTQTDNMWDLDIT